jgi:hypothetical protein
MAIKVVVGPARNSDSGSRLALGRPPGAWGGKSRQSRQAAQEQTDADEDEAPDHPASGFDHPSPEGTVEGCQEIGDRETDQRSAQRTTKSIVARRTQREGKTTISQGVARAAVEVRTEGTTGHVVIDAVRLLPVPR